MPSAVAYDHIPDPSIGLGKAADCGPDSDDLDCWALLCKVNHSAVHLFLPYRTVL